MHRCASCVPRHELNFAFAALACAIAFAKPRFAYLAPSAMCASPGLPASLASLRLPCQGVSMRHVQKASACSLVLQNRPVE
eukprot:7843639-Alexandrium_andersonii.AAC.1